MYVDAVIYLRQHAKDMETNKYQSEFCLDIVEKAKFLYELKKHLFDPSMKEALENQIERYKNDKKFHINETSNE